MKQQAIIGIDIGTTSTKAVAFSFTGKELFQYAVTYPINKPQPAYAEQDPELIFQAVLTTLKSVIALLQNGDFVLRGVSFSSAMHSLIAMDASGNNLTNSIIWADARSINQAQRLRNSSIGYDIYLHTGTPIHAMSSLTKICWLREMQPAIFEQIAKFIGIKEYVFYRLYGKYKIDYSIASATGLFNIFTHQWHSDSLSFAGITPDKLSEPVLPTYTFRGMHTHFANELCIDTDLPFVIGASDGCLANLGTNAVNEGDAVITIGTSGAMRVIADNPVTDKGERIFSYILTPEKYVLGGAVNNGGIVLQWFQRNFYQADSEAIKGGKEHIFELLNTEAASVKPGADGLIFLPYLLGERAPIWDATAKASFCGIDITHTRAHFLRALMEGVIFGIYSVGKALEQTVGPVKVIYANGGFTKSEVWVQILADVFNVKVHVTDTAEGSALGAAILGMKSLGVLDRLADAQNLISIKKTYLPDPEAHNVYSKNYAVFEKLYPSIKDAFNKD